MKKPKIAQNRPFFSKNCEPYHKNQKIISANLEFELFVGVVRDALEDGVAGNGDNALVDTAIFFFFFFFWVY
jgi:hypothetical protein